MSPGYQGPPDNLEYKKEEHSVVDYDPGLLPENDRLRKAIIHMLKEHPEFNSSGVRVSAKGNVIMLSGKVDGPIAKATIEGYVRDYNGVDEVVSTLEIDDELLSGIQGITLK